MQRRALHADKGRGARDVAGKAGHLRQQIFALKDLARVAYEEGPLSFRRIVSILKQTLAALSEAHHLGIIHRDLKPENIILETTRSGSDFVKVVDFGLAKIRIDAVQPNITYSVTSGGGNVSNGGLFTAPGVTLYNASVGEKTDANVVRVGLNYRF